MIIISAERRPLLDIGLPQVSQQEPVPCFSHPAVSRAFHQVIGPPCRGPSHSRNLRLHRSSILRAMGPTHCHLSLAILRAMSVTLVSLQISSFLIRSRQESSSIALSIALWMTTQKAHCDRPIKKKKKKWASFKRSSPKPRVDNDILPIFVVTCC